MNYDTREFTYVEYEKTLILTFFRLKKSGKIVIRLVDLVKFLGVQNSGQIVKKLTKAGKLDFVEHYNYRHMLLTKVSAEDANWQYFAAAENVASILSLYFNNGVNKLDLVRFDRWIKAGMNVMNNTLNPSIVKEKSRPNVGESVYYVKSSKRWRAAIVLGRDENGRIKGKSFDGMTKEEAECRLEEFKRNASIAELTPAIVKKNTKDKTTKDKLDNLIQSVSLMAESFSKIFAEINSLKSELENVKNAEIEERKQSINSAIKKEDRAEKVIMQDAVPVLSKNTILV